MKFLALVAIAFSAATPAPTKPLLVKPLLMTPARQSYCFKVDILGSGKPIILIPGLTCTGAIWEGTVNQLKGKYKCYVLTLPGFGKQPPIAGPYISHVRDDIIAYVKANKLDHPAVIGHSLGGFMTYNLAVQEPDLWGPMISVDGLPFLSVLMNPQATAENMKPGAAALANQMATSSPEDFKRGIKQSLASQITDPKNVEMVNATSQDADQVDVGLVFNEMLTTDLRSQLGKIHTPFLLIGAGQQATSDALKKSLLKTYSSQIKNLKGATLIMDWKARHFVMLDDPSGFYVQVKAFLAAY